MTARRPLIQALGFLIATCVLTPTFANAAAPKTKAEHIAIAEKYEEMAVEQDAISQEHNQMLKDYRANAAHYPKQVRQKRIAEMRSTAPRSCGHPINWPTSTGPWRDGIGQPPSTWNDKTSAARGPRWP